MTRDALTAFVLVALLVGPTVLASAQSGAGVPGPVFRIEEDSEARRGMISGWLYNDGQGVVGLVRLRLEVLDPSGRVTGEHFGWAYGNVPPGGRAYFRIALPTAAPARRLTVESFVLQSLQTP